VRAAAGVEDFTRRSRRSLQGLAVAVLAPRDAPAVGLGLHLFKKDAVGGAVELAALNLAAHHARVLRETLAGEGSEAGRGGAASGIGEREGLER
jgi:hypothetical protein